MKQQELIEILQYTARREIPLHFYPVSTMCWAGCWALSAGWGCLAAQTLLIMVKSMYGISYCFSITGFSEHPAQRKRRIIIYRKQGADVPGNPNSPMLKWITTRPMNTSVHIHQYSTGSSLPNKNFSFCSTPVDSVTLLLQFASLNNDNKCVDCCKKHIS